jgi:hypothetical protein
LNSIKMKIKIKLKIFPISQINKRMNGLRKEDERSFQFQLS